MNILYCGDKNIIDGLVISILSLMKNTKENLNIYVLSMKYEDENKKYSIIPKAYINELNKLVKKVNKESFVKLIDITDLVNKELPEANIDTRFTPYCMLRLYADQINELPDKILYLDTDVVCLKDPIELYNIDITNYEIAGVLDYYGSHFYKKKIYKKDYLNSGVLLLNLKLIKKTKLFKKSREMCKSVKMLLPDQSALNKLSKHKLIIKRKFNEQKKIKKNTIFRHFTTTFKFFPKFHTQTIKPWNIDKLHSILKVHEFDDILEDYKQIIRRFKHE